MSILENIFKIENMKLSLSILSKLFTKVENHYHNPIIFQVNNEEKALRIAKECSNIHVEVEETAEVQEMENQ